MRPFARSARLDRVFWGEWRTMSAALPLKARDAARNRGAAGNQRRAGVRLCCQNSGINRGDIMAIHLDHMPPRRGETGGNVLADRQSCVAVIGDMVVIPKKCQTP